MCLGNFRISICSLIVKVLLNLWTFTKKVIKTYSSMILFPFFHASQNSSKTDVQQSKTFTAKHNVLTNSQYGFSKVT